jgi:hypothetical protein
MKDETNAPLSSRISALKFDPCLAEEFMAGAVAYRQGYRDAVRAATALAVSAEMEKAPSCTWAAHSASRAKKQTRAKA